MRACRSCRDLGEATRLMTTPRLRLVGPWGSFLAFLFALLWHIRRSPSLSVRIKMEPHNGTPCNRLRRHALPTALPHSNLFIYLYARTARQCWNKDSVQTAFTILRVTAVALTLLPPWIPYVLSVAGARGKGRSGTQAGVRAGDCSSNLIPVVV